VWSVLKVVCGEFLERMKGGNRSESDGVSDMIMMKQKKVARIYHAAVSVASLCLIRFTYLNEGWKF